MTVSIYPSLTALSNEGVFVGVKCYEKKPSKIYVWLRICGHLTLVCAGLIFLHDLARSPVTCTTKVKAIETYCMTNDLAAVRSSSLQERKRVESSTKETKSLKFYFWIPYFLLFQSLTFFLPNYLWSDVEDTNVGGTIAYLRTGNSQKNVLLSAMYFLQTRGTRNFWALKMIFYEFLGVAIIAGNILFMDWYLDRRLIEISPEILEKILHHLDFGDSFETAFPVIVPCTFSMYGTSGTLQNKHTICILTRNLMAGRLFVLLCLALLVSLVACFSTLLWRIASCCIPTLRELSLLRQVLEKTHKNDVIYLLKHTGTADWFYLNRLSSILFDFGTWMRSVNQLLKDEKAEKFLLRQINQELDSFTPLYRFRRVRFLDQDS